MNGDEFGGSQIVNQLLNQSIGFLILLSCNVGHLDYYHYNRASIVDYFTKLMPNTPVFASDGTVYTQNFWGQYESRNDPRFRDLTYKYSDGTCRNNYGWVKFWYTSGYYCYTSGYGKFLTMAQMLAILAPYGGLGSGGSFTGGGGGGIGGGGGGIW